MERVEELIYANPHNLKDANNTHWRKNDLFKEQCSENWISSGSMNLDHFYLLSFSKVNFKWVKDLKCKTWNSEIVRGKSGENRYKQGLPE